MAKWRDQGGADTLPADHRLKELALAMVIPWGDGWPQYYAGEMYSREWCERMQEVERATKNEVLPWQR